ncbi:MAG: uracil-DNA glycosylase [Candidatus Omnitrophica bacterium]|nr:uracil-DNA glycosylase [Candidatus Omnitrophota bacterium]
MDEFKRIINSLKAAVESERLAGMDAIYFPRKKRDSSAAENETLEMLETEALKCRCCPLVKTRTNVVFGEGDPAARLMFIGEAPGADEDRQGRPFVGRAGQLLTRIIEAIGLGRKEVYIANILKCRPPGNRNPLPEEIAACHPYLEHQVDIIKPRVICALGKFAAQTLLRSESPISRLRGRFYDYHGVKLMPTYHPAYLLRNPEGKKDVWEDMKKIAKELGLNVPRGKTN